MPITKPEIPPIKGFSLQGADIIHYQRTEAYAAIVNKLYNQAVRSFSVVAAKLNINPNNAFKFTDYPSANKEVQKILSELFNNVKAVIDTGSREEWIYANKKNDAFLKSILNTSNIDPALLAKWQDRNLDALKAFQTRKVDGLDISGRVWKYVDQFKSNMELGIDVGIGQGKSAAQLAQVLQQFLQAPDNLFRRVRDKRGNLHLSKAAKDYHPGQGVYRSSHKNAMRLSRSEINMAYRQSDLLRWQKLDFVLGFEIRRSNHEYDCEVCDQLKGQYPKWFIFKGWHPQCRCYMIPILQEYEELRSDRRSRFRAALNGEEYKKYPSKKAIEDVPQGFKDWVSNNADRSQGWKSQPYFIRDNFKGGMLEGGLKITGVNDILPKINQNINLREVFYNNIDKATTIKSINSLTREELKNIGQNVKVSMSPKYIDLDTAKTYAKKLVSLSDEYNAELPFTSFSTKQNLSSYGYIEPLKESGVRANYKWEIKGVGMNVGKKVDPSRLENIATFKSLSDPENLQVSTLTHEFGHLLHSSYNTSETAAAFRNEIRDIYENYISELFLSGRGSAEFNAINLGETANRSMNEFIAEAFQEYKNRKNPSKYAIKTGKIMDRYFLKQKP